MSFPVRYERDSDIGSIDLDDGKVNAPNPDTFDALLAAFDEAKQDGMRAVALSGNERYCSPGLDEVAIGLAPPFYTIERGSAFRSTKPPRPRHSEKHDG